MSIEKKLNIFRRLSCDLSFEANAETNIYWKIRHLKNFGTHTSFKIRRKKAKRKTTTTSHDREEWDCETSERFQPIHLCFRASTHRHRCIPAAVMRIGHRLAGAILWYDRIAFGSTDAKWKRQRLFEVRTKASVCVASRQSHHHTNFKCKVSNFRMEIHCRRQREKVLFTFFKEIFLKNVSHRHCVDATQELFCIFSIKKSVVCACEQWLPHFPLTCERNEPNPLQSTTKGARSCRSFQFAPAICNGKINLS